MSIQSAYRQEQEKLIETLEEIGRQQSAIGPRYYGDDYVEQLLDEKREENRRRLELLSAEPYFGRLDFQEKGREGEARLYIGKRGMEHVETGKPYIIDWRAPAASLFYSFTGGEETVDYEAPDGTIEGWVHRKRNLAIRDRTLQRVVDSYVRGEDNLGVTDEFLLYRLGENKDNRLRDIVSTIQAEQDRIIRAPKEKALIIQGAAGSGKTTVALHRLAYILYRYRDEVKAENMIVFAPNLMFLDYISGVLPELGVGNIRQTTFIEWAMELLEHAVKLKSEDGSAWFAIKNRSQELSEQTAGRFKGSLHYKQLIQKKLTLYEEQLPLHEDFSPWEGRVLTADTMREWFTKELACYSLYERRERLAARIRRWLEIAMAESPAFAVQKEKAKNAKKKLQAFIKKLPVPDPVQFYKQLYGADKQSVSWLDLKNEIPAGIYEATRNTLMKDTAAYEDLPALLWIRRSFRGIEGNRFDHVVVDEAQDASPFQIALLRAHMKQPSFTILGDLAQGIHDYRGIHQWSEFEPIFELTDISFHTLRQSYRSTTEIIEFANRILEKAGTGLPPAVPVFRSGEQVRILRTDSRESRIRRIKQFIETERKKGLLTIALITRTPEESRAIIQELLPFEPDAVLIEEGQQSYKGGISVLPAHLSKGLEFDAVLLPDVDADRYIATQRDAKLLYVACTRALHTLEIHHIDDRSELISG